MKIRTMYAITSVNAYGTRLSSIVSCETMAKINVDYLNKEDEINKIDEYGDTFSYELVTVFDYEEEGCYK